MKTVATGKKVILSNQQRQAAQLIFGDELAKSIISAAQKQVDALASAAGDLKAAVADFDSRLTSFERIKGIDIGSRFYQRNGKPADDLAGRLFGRGAQ